MYKQIDFRFRCQVGATSLHAPLLQYLQSKQTEFPRELMVLWSLSAFWYPLADKWRGNSNQAELKQKARNAIYELQKQIYYLAQNFGLEPQDFAFPPMGYEMNGLCNQMSISEESTKAPTPIGDLTTTSADTSYVTIGPENTNEFRPPIPPADLLMNNADDKALDEAFEN